MYKGDKILAILFRKNMQTLDFQIQENVQT